MIGQPLLRTPPNPSLVDPRRVNVRCPESASRADCAPGCPIGGPYLRLTFVGTRSGHSWRAHRHHDRPASSLAGSSGPFKLQSNFPA